FIEMFYHFREEVIHRAGLGRMGFHCVDKDMTWQMNAIMLPKEISDIIETYDQRSEFEPITRWGVYGNGQSFLEPFRFVRATTGKLVEFCNKYFELLDFDKRLEQYPEVRHSMEESNKTKAHQDYANYLALFVKDHLGF
ncbi:MAG: hypothetical protein NTX81_02380, partial [Candidatus Bathyarchaeota archaeon]|nr:hypothetical protein [Candidatus Bathyarchaeota archaeon]